jgi:hypothetical protein
LRYLDGVVIRGGEAEEVMLVMSSVYFYNNQRVRGDKMKPFHFIKLTLLRAVV